jgi:hypothetical protein
MKRLVGMAIMTLSCHSMASTTLILDQSVVQAYVADVIPGQNGQPDTLVPSVFWQGMRIEKDGNGVCTKTTQSLDGYNDSAKMGITLRDPKLNTHDEVVKCPA